MVSETIVNVIKYTHSIPQCTAKSLQLTCKKTTTTENCVWGGAGGWFKPSNKTAGFLIVFLIHLAIIQIADAVLAMAKCKIVLLFFV